MIELVSFKTEDCASEMKLGFQDYKKN